MKPLLITCLIFISNFLYSQEDHYLVRVTDSTDQHKYHLFSINGEKLTANAYDWVTINEWNWVIAKTDTLFEVFDRNGNHLGIDSVEQIDDVSATHTLYVPIKKGNKWGYYDRNGQLVIEHKFGDAAYFWGGKAGVKISDSTYFIDTLGNVLKEPYHNRFNYDEFMRLYTAVALTSWQGGPMETYTKRGKVGLRNSDTKRVLIKARYDDMYSIGDKNVIVRIGDNFGVVSFEDQLKIPIKYEMIYLLEDNK